MVEMSFYSCIFTLFMYIFVHLHLSFLLTLKHYRNVDQRVKGDNESNVFHHCFSCTLTHGGCRSQSQLSLGEGAASPWTSQQFIRGPHKRQTTVCTHTHSCLEFPVGLVSMSVDSERMLEGPTCKHYAVR